MFAFHFSFFCFCTVELVKRGCSRHSRLLQKKKKEKRKKKRRGWDIEEVQICGSIKKQQKAANSSMKRTLSIAPQPSPQPSPRASRSASLSPQPKKSRLSSTAAAAVDADLEVYLGPNVKIYVKNGETVKLFRGVGGVKLRVGGPDDGIYFIVDPRQIEALKLAEGCIFGSPTNGELDDIQPTFFAVGLRFLAEEAGRKSPFANLADLLETGSLVVPSSFGENQKAFLEAVQGICPHFAPAQKHEVVISKSMGGSLESKYLLDPEFVQLIKAYKAGQGNESSAAIKEYMLKHKIKFEDGVKKRDFQSLCDDLSVREVEKDEIFQFVCGVDKGAINVEYDQPSDFFAVANKWTLPLAPIS